MTRADGLTSFEGRVRRCGAAPRRTPHCRLLDEGDQAQATATTARNTEARLARFNGLSAPTLYDPESERWPAALVVRRWPAGAFHS
jgi:hypothetical protein